MWLKCLFEPWALPIPASEWPSRLNYLQVSEPSTSFPVFDCPCLNLCEGRIITKINSVDEAKHSTWCLCAAYNCVCTRIGFNKWPLSLICVYTASQLFLEPGWQKFASEATAANHTLWAQQISQCHKWGLIQEEVKKTCYHGSSYLMTPVVSVPCNAFHAFLNCKPQGDSI